MARPDSPRLFLGRGPRRSSRQRRSETRAAREFTFDSAYVIRSADLAELRSSASFAPKRPFLQCVLDLTERIHSDSSFFPAPPKSARRSRDVLRMRKGVCQDFAHLQLGCLRSLGLAARYVSGYLVTTPPPGKPRLQGADVSHAWVSVFAPDPGWMDFDPTNGLIPSKRTSRSPGPAITMISAPSAACSSAAAASASMLRSTLSADS